MFSKVSFWIFVLFTIIIAVAIGLYLGWVAWPVEWVDAAPANMRVEYQTEWMNMAIDSYAVNQSSELAAQRYNEAGAGAPDILAGILADPIWVSADNAEAYAMAVNNQSTVEVAFPPGAPPAEQQAAEDSTQQNTYMLAILCLALLAIVLLVILVVRLFRRRNHAVSEPTSPGDEPAGGEAALEETSTEVVEEAEAVEMEGEEAQVDELEADTDEVSEDDDGSAGRAALVAAGAAGLAAVALHEGEQESAEETPAADSDASAAVLAAGAVAADDDLGWALEEPVEGLAEGADNAAVEELPADYYGKYNRKIVEVEGIGPAYAQRLEAAGIPTVQAYLQQCATPKGRQELAEKTGISGKLILDWANDIDMMRVSGIGPQWSDLLEKAGVNTVRELATRNPAHLLVKLEEANAEKNLVRVLPRIDQLEDWIEQAKDLPRILSY